MDREEIIKTIKEAYSKSEYPIDKGGDYPISIAKLEDKYDRYYIYKLEGLYYIIYDPLEGFYKYICTLEEFLDRENLCIGELLEYIVH
jgi:hypothetical protein